MAEAIRKVLKDERQLTTVATNAFTDADSDRSGYIDEKELMKVMTKVCTALNTPKPSSSQLKEVLKAMDQNKDGKLSLQEYIVLVKAVLQATLRKLENDSSVTPDPKVAEPSKDVEKIEAQVDKQLQLFEKYLQDSGIGLAFQIIYVEILTKKIDAENVFTYTAMRLRQIGKEVAHLLPSNLTANISDHQ